MNFQNEIAKKLLEIKAVSIVDRAHLYTWASGIKSPIYCDNRMTMSYPVVRKLIADGFTDLIKREYPETELIAGAAMGGIPHAAWVADQLNLPMVYVRAQAKEHGKGNLVEGFAKPGLKAIVIEDLLSTGGSSIKVVQALKELGVEVLAVVAIFNYGFPQVDLAFEDEEVPYHALTNYQTLLPIAVEAGYIKDSDLEELKAWSENPRLFTTS